MMMDKRFRALIGSVAAKISLIILAILASHSPHTTAATVQFTEVAEAAGIGSDSYSSTTAHALGVNWIDIDKDGWPDLFFVNGYNGSGAHLYRNEGDGTFSRQDALLPVLPNVEMMGSVFADYDNDGDSDIYIFTDHGESGVPEQPEAGPVNILLKNLWVENGRQILPGQPLFVDETAAAGVEDLLDAPHEDGPAYRSSTGGWLDYDRDGLTDLYICHWRRGASEDSLLQDRLYRNQGDGTFLDVTAAVGIVPETDGSYYKTCLAFMAAHLDSDMWPDLFIGNIGGPPGSNDILFQNNAGAGFIDRTADSPGFGDDANSAMGVTTGDTELDGAWDLYISDLEGGPQPGVNPLYVHTGTDIIFNDNSAFAAGVDGDGSWGVNFLDVDQDSYEDLFVATMGLDPSILYLNNPGTGTFTPYSGGLGGKLSSRGSAYADYDRDGDLDIAVASHNGRVQLFRNDTVDSGNWLQVHLLANEDQTALWSNRDGIGSVVKATVADKVLMRQIIGGDSGHGQNSLNPHFGLDTAESVGQLDVYWPSGSNLSFSNLPANTFVAVSEQGLAAALTSPSLDVAALSETTVFQWMQSGPLTVDSWRLLVGTGVGGTEIYDSSALPAETVSAEVSGLPTDGSQVYVRLEFQLSGISYHVDYRYGEGEGVPPPPVPVPALASPASGSILAGSTATFAWDAMGAEVDSWTLEIGTAAGASDLLDTGVLDAGTLSYDASGLPVDGSTVYVRLSWSIAGVWSAADYVYTAYDESDPPPAAPGLVSPAPGSVLSGNTETFTWNPNGSAVTKWQLKVGSSAGASDLYLKTLDSEELATTVSGLPTNGGTVYVRLLWRISGVVSSTDYVYTAFDDGVPPPPGPPSISSPEAGSVLTSSEVVFEWGDNGTSVDNWKLEVGTSAGASDLLNTEELTASTLSYAVSTLPVDGSTIYVRLSWNIAGAWSSADSVYTAFDESEPPSSTPGLESPAPGSVLTGSSPTFSWDANGAAVTKWQIKIGSSVGASDLYLKVLDAGETSTTASGLPTDGSTVYVRLLWRISGVVSSLDYVYTAFDDGVPPPPGLPALSTPVAGSELAGADVIFEWQDNGAAVDNWRLEVGTSPGNSDLLDTGELAASTLAYEVSSLPLDGSTIYVRLSWSIAGVWSTDDYEFTAYNESEPPPSSPDLESPVPGSVLTDVTETFTWNASGSAVTRWQLRVGSSPGASDYFIGTFGGGVLSASVDGLPTDGTTVYVRLLWRIGSALEFVDYSYTSFTASQHSVARIWNDVLLESIRKDFARPTVHARNLWHTSAAMFDTWSVYEDIAGTYLVGKDIGEFNCPLESFPEPEDIHLAREEAISFAIYRLIHHRFAYSPAYSVMNTSAEEVMVERGYDTSVTSLDYSGGSAAALGNYIADCYIRYGLQDGANEVNDYANNYYSPVNPNIKPYDPGNPTIIDLDRWQPISLPISIDQSGNVIYGEPTFLSPEWGDVIPFSLTESDVTTYNRDGHDYRVFLDPGAPPTHGTEEYQWGFSMVSIWSSHLDESDGVMIDISPASLGNPDYYPTTTDEYADYFDYFNGGDSSRGYAVNPVTGAPYTPQFVPRGDYARVLAEFWADGPDSETPPGHWFVILNTVSDHPLFEKRFGGTGPVLDSLEWDVKSYFAMGGAMHDSAIAAWSIKGWYDYLRPVSAIRAMADRGQSTDVEGDYYDPDGLPLVPGYVEVVHPGDPLAGEADEHVGKMKLYAWRGPEHIDDPAIDQAGVGWILAENWWPYQRPSFVTPPFAGYVSGHSTYSRAAANIMTALTGSEYFPGGMSDFEINANEFLVFEEGPSVDMVLQWATYRDASDQTSLSRIWGGIHPPVDDIPGRAIGEYIGTTAFELAEEYFTGLR